MSEQKQIGQLFAVIMQNMPEMTVEQRQKWISNPQGLKKFLLGLVCLPSKAPNPATHIFVDKIDYQLSIDQLVEIGRYKWFNSHIKILTDLPFDADIKEINLRLFSFEANLDQGDVIIEMDKVGYRPATIKELLNFGANHPELQLEFPIVALGSHLSQYNYPYLGVGRNGRDVDLGRFFDGNHCNCRFLGILNK